MEAKLIILLGIVVALVTAEPSHDLGYADVSCFGHPTIRSPNINKLAAEGMKFTQFYSGAPICSPSRGSILTGRLPIRTGIYSGLDYPLNLLFRVFYPWSTGGLPASEITIAKALKTKGYKSAIIGKWHLGHYNNTLPTQNGGFDYFYGLPYSQDEGCPPGYKMPCDRDWEEIWPGVPLYQNEKIIQQPVNLQTLVPRYTQEALKFIESNANTSTPFFLYMAYDEVHVPLFASPAFQNTSKRGLFGDAVAEMDDSIGKIINKLKELKLDSNTLVFFTSDNGPWIDQGLDGGSAGMLRGGKGSTWEGGMREPAIAWWPGKIKPGEINMDIGSTMDLFVTSLELAGVPIPKDRAIDGVSLLPALFGTGPIDRKVYFYYRDDLLYAVRYGPYKAHFKTQDGFGYLPPEEHDPPLLYQLEHDPAEQFPLDPNTAESQQILQEIKQAVAEHRQNLIPGPRQLNEEDPLVAPCCNRDTNCFCGPW